MHSLRDGRKNLRHTAPPYLTAFNGSRSAFSGKRAVQRAGAVDVKRICLIQAERFHLLGNADFNIGKLPDHLMAELRTFSQINQKRRHSAQRSNLIPHGYVGIVSHNFDGQNVADCVRNPLKTSLCLLLIQGKHGQAEFFQRLLRFQLILILVGNNVIVGVGSQNLLLHRYADSSAGKRLWDREIRRQNHIRREILPLKKFFPEKILRLAQNRIFALQRERTIHIQFVKGNFIDQHNRADHLQIVNRPVKNPPLIVCL